MNIRNVTLIAVAGSFFAAGAQAQTFRRQAAIVGGGDRERGRCTVEIVVDGAAEIAFRGTDATVTNLKGQMPEIRRFECTSPLPPNAGEVRFNGVSGRGRQELIGGGRDGSVAVRVEDPQNGSDRYIFEFSWRSGFGPGLMPGPMPGPMTDRRGGRRFTVEQAVETCKAASRQQVAERFHTQDINFRETRMDDAPGRNDWVIGTLEARHRDGADEILKFSCSVDFETGQVRSAEVLPLRPEGPVMNPAATQNCRRAVEERLRGQGYRRIAFGNINVDDRPGRRDWIIGDVNAEGQRGGESLQFSCSVDLRDGDVRSVDVNSRR